MAESESGRCLCQNRSHCRNTLSLRELVSMLWAQIWKVLRGNARRCRNSALRTCSPVVEFTPRKMGEEQDFEISGNVCAYWIRSGERGGRIVYRVRRAVKEGHGKMNAYLEFHVIYGQKLLSAQESLKRKRTTVYVRIDPDSV
jgi:hypothetical protein